ncbi:MIP/aquaporin family protein [Bdellovibrionota bacterium FG-1]
MLGELLGTFILVFFGCGSIAVTVLFSAHIGLFQVAAIWGIGVSLAIYSARHLSCAHLNPAVSLAMVVVGRMSWREIPSYWMAQLCGAILAALTLYALFCGSITAFELSHQIVRGAPESVQTAMMFGEYFPNPSVTISPAAVSMGSAFLAEALGTFLLVMLIFFVTDTCNAGRPDDGITPLLIGAALTALISLLAPLGQAGFNPARDFGPRIIAYLFGWGEVAIPGPRGGFFVIYIFGPLTGSTAAAVLFRYVFAPLMKSQLSDSNECKTKDPAA